MWVHTNKIETKHTNLVEMENGKKHFDNEYYDKRKKHPPYLRMLILIPIKFLKQIEIGIVCPIGTSFNKV